MQDQDQGSETQDLQKNGLKTETWSRDYNTGAFWISRKRGVFPTLFANLETGFFFRESVLEMKK